MDIKLSAYRLSTDYDRLIDLLDKGYEVICLADYNAIGEHPPERDVCVAKRRDNRYSIGARSAEYCGYTLGASERYETFQRRLSRHNVEFVDLEFTEQ